MKSVVFDCQKLLKSVNCHAVQGKITSYIEDYLKSDNDKILILEGARQIGKSFSIREVGTRLYPNFVEINFVEDDEGEQLFKNIHKKEDFYLTLSMVAGDKLNNRDDTLVLLDEIQHYPRTSPC